MWEADVLPPSWKTSVLCSLKKPGKEPKLTTRYRPIALISIFCKIFERMVNFRLVYHMELHGLISPCQFGFRKNLLILDLLLKLNTFIQNGGCIAVFFTLKKILYYFEKKGSYGK